MSDKPREERLHIGAYVPKKLKWRIEWMAKRETRENTSAMIEKLLMEALAVRGVK